MHCFPDICYKSKFCDITDELDILASFLGQSSSLAEVNLKKDLLELIHLTYISIDVLRDLKDFPSDYISRINIIYNKYRFNKGIMSHENFCKNNIGNFIYTIDLCRSFSEKIKILYYDTFGDNCQKYTYMKIFINLLHDVLEMITDSAKIFITHKK
jgi:hypothetical protein